MAEPSGSFVGPYRLLGPVGRGGFATVYRARDERLDGDVAIKILAENHALDPDIRERFLTEAQLLRRVDCAHVVRVHDIGETDRHQPYLVMELAARGDLAGRVSARRRDGWTPSRADTSRVARALAEALAALHAHDIVHRDVSPRNLLIRATDPVPGSAGGTLLAGDERLVLADLGYAKDLRAHSGITVGGGTQGFHAPEQAGIGTIDHRADVYAAAAVMAWMLTGDDPTAHRREVGAWLAGHDVDPATAAVLARSLDVDPAGRPSDIVAWYTALDAALRPQLPSPPVASSRHAPEVVDQRQARRGRRRRRLAPIIAAVALALATGATIGASVARYRRGGDGGATTTHLRDGRVRVASVRGSLAAAIFGPAVVRVGEPVLLEAGVSGASTYRWLLPSGQTAATAAVTLTPAASGAVDVVLVATGPDGAQVAVTHRLTVEP